MTNAPNSSKRRKVPWVLGLLTVTSFVLLIILQSTNLWKNLSIESSGDLLLLYALSSLNFIALVIFGFIFLRSIIKLVRERRTFELGAQIKTRLLIYFFIVSLLPIFAMAVFSYLFMNRALERWFTAIPVNVIREAREVQTQSLIDRSAKLNESAKMLAAVLEDRETSDIELQKIADAGRLVYLSIRAADGRSLAVVAREIPDELKPELAMLIEAIDKGDASDPLYSDGRGFDAAIVPLKDGRKLAIVPDLFGERTVSQLIENSLIEFEQLKQKQLTIRRVGLLTLGVLTFLLIFTSTWIAFYVARGLTGPIKALAQGAERIAAGDLGHRVDVLAEDELAILVNAFNEMSARLDANSAELTERRKYIETVLDGLPTGVVSFDHDGRVSTINNAAIKMLDAVEPKDELRIDSFSNVAANGVFERLAARARRVGHASDQVVLGNTLPEAERTVAITASALPDDGGVVLVIEDLSELIAAQRASAWQEVARRMAHEIKNPLTPIQLSAERIAKRFDRAEHIDTGNARRIDDRGPIGDVVHESTATILREVASLKMMVDEFSRFARLPETELVAGDLVEIIRQSVASFDGRFPGVSIEFAESGTLPQIMLDAEQLKRVFVNLIDNAVEAFTDDDLEKNILITARHDAARDIIVAEVADTGKGIAQSDLQKLFQPYFSTKGRGTGLGLAIVKRMIAEHNGRINAVANQPKGARFIIELPVNS